MAASNDTGDGRPHGRLLFGRFRPWMAMVAVVTILAGLLFGYDQGVISGALGFIAKDFDLSRRSRGRHQLGDLGALAGALLAGILADRVGPQRTLLLAGVLFLVGAAIEAFAPGTPILVVGRFVVGAGVGVASVAGPLYAAEMAPKQTRGRFVSSYQLAITIGILLADIVDAAFSASGEWRVMLGLAIIPGIMLIIVVSVMPDTPRWLMKMGRRTDAKASLTKTQGGPDVDRRLDVIQRDLEGTTGCEVARGVRPVDAPSALGGDRSCGVPADHRDQRDHLLLERDLRSRRVHHRDAAG